MRIQMRLRRTRWGRVARDGCYIFLVTAGWFASNLLVILGCIVAMFLVISHGQVDQFFLHVDNLASRYISADVARRVGFEHFMVQVFAVLLVGTLLLRGPGFIARVRRNLADGRTS
jgi:hypothetical protein